MSEPAADSPVPPGQGAGNGARPREPVFNLPPVVLAFIAICVAAYGVTSFMLDDEQYFWVIVHAAFIPILYGGQAPVDFHPVAGPVTYSLLHGSIAHLGVNMIWLAAFGTPLANRIGALRFVLFWIVTSMAAAGLHYFVYSTSQTPLIGASGAVSGMMGAAARFGFRIDRTSGRPAFGGPVLSIATVMTMRNTLAFLAMWMVINAVTGLIGVEPGQESQIAWEAHVGGFVVGFFFVSAFDRRQSFRDA